MQTVVFTRAPGTTHNNKSYPTSALPLQLPLIRVSNLGLHPRIKSAMLNCVGLHQDDFP